MVEIEVGNKYTSSQVPVGNQVLALRPPDGLSASSAHEEPRTARPQGRHMMNTDDLKNERLHRYAPTSFLQHVVSLQSCRMAACLLVLARRERGTRNSI